jgi:peptide/nickel transport system ATP-binding protein
VSAPAAPLLSVRDLRSYLATGHGVVRAVDGVSFTVHDAEVLGIVGESGCGKTVTCRTIMGLMPRGTAYSSGEVIYHPRGEGSILAASSSDWQSLRGSQLAMIFQDPMTALNPVLNIGDQLLEAVNAHASLSRQDARALAVDLLTQVGIPGPGQADARLPVPVQRRHAAARADRDRAGVLPPAAARRRADDLARRHHPGPDPQPAARAAARYRDEHDPGQP